jgi:hypothetical protein
MGKGKKIASKTANASKSSSLLEGLTFATTLCLNISIEYLLRYLENRPDPVAHEDYVNEQIEAFEEREQKVVSSLSLLLLIIYRDWRRYRRWKVKLMRKALLP